MLTPIERDLVRKLDRKGWGTTHITKEVGCSRSTVYRILNGEPKYGNIHINQSTESTHLLNSNIKKQNQEMNKQKTYFIKDRNNDFIKIGKSSDPKERLLVLNQGNPLKLELIHTTDYSERDLHIQFREHRQRGEWFKLSTEIIEWILKDLKGRKAKTEREIKEIKRLRKGMLEE